MKNFKYLLASSLVIIGLISCSKTASKPEIEMPELPTERMAALAEEPLSTLQAGHGVFTLHCFQCHSQPSLTKFSDSEWSTIAPTMSKHAGITETEGVQVLAYILATKRLEGH